MTQRGRSAKAALPSREGRRAAPLRLDRRRIAIGGPRRMKELSELVRNLGGEPLERPLMGTVPLDDPAVAEPLRRLAERGADWVVATTGVGTRSLIAAAERFAIRDEVVGRMRDARVAARGYKTLNALRELEIAPLVTDTDGSVEGLISALTPHDLSGKRVAVQLYGSEDPRLIGWLRERGADVDEILLYRYIPPEDDLVERILHEIVNGEIDAVAFTSVPQVHYLFDAARARGVDAAVRDAFERGAPVALSQGAVTSGGLRRQGVRRIVAPANERMGAMIMALARHFAGEGDDDRPSR